MVKKKLKSHNWTQQKEKEGEGRERVGRREEGRGKQLLTESFVARKCCKKFLPFAVECFKIEENGNESRNHFAF